jgi:hypothetical protein
VRRLDNIIRGIVNTFLNGWTSGFPLCCILEFTFRSQIMYSGTKRMVSQFHPYRKVYDRDAKKTHNHYAACHLCYWRGLAYKESKKKDWVCDAFHEIPGVDRITMKDAGEYSIPYSTQYPTNRISMSMFDKIPRQEYEQIRDKVIEFLITRKGNMGDLLSLEFLNHHLKLDEKYPPAYVVSRMVNEGILEAAVFYNKINNTLSATGGYRLK